VCDGLQKFHKPILTPFELALALVPGLAWDGRDVMDFTNLLRRVHDADGSDGPSIADGDCSDDDAPEFSIVTGGYTKRRARRPEAAAAAVVDSTGMQQQLVSTGSQELAVRFESAAADFLAKRSFQGLDVSHPVPNDDRIVTGLSGIASGYAGRDGDSRTHTSSSP
jgi:diphthamide biosynthesis protein 2